MMLIQLQLSTNHAANMNTITARRKSTIQISSSSPTYPTPPPSAPASPSSYSTSWPSSSSSSTSSSSTSSSASPPSTSTSPPPAPPRKVRVPLLSPGGLYSSSSPLLTPPTPPSSSAPHQTSEEPPAKRTKLDPKALAEASKNLTQTLKQLSSEVLTTKPEASSQKPKKEVSSLPELPLNLVTYVLLLTFILTYKTLRNDESAGRQIQREQSLSLCITTERASTAGRSVAP